jgi:molybdopterin converting factor small subunit
MCTESMVVTIELFGAFRDTVQSDTVSMPLTGETVVRDALAYLGNMYPGLGFSEESVFVTVNGEVASPDRVLKADDVICILPPIGGG